MAKKAEIKRDLTNCYTVRQTAQLLGLTVKRVRQLLNEGKLTRVATDPIILIDQIEAIEFKKIREADPRKSPAYSTYNKKTDLDKLVEQFQKTIELTVENNRRALEMSSEASKRVEENYLRQIQELRAELERARARRWFKR